MDLSQLRYVAAGRVDDAPMDLSRCFVEGADARPLGQLAGFLVDPVAKRLRYLVVETRRWFGSPRRLIPFTTTRVDADRGALQVDVPSGVLESAAEFDPDAVHEL